MVKLLTLRILPSLENCIFQESNVTSLNTGFVCGVYNFTFHLQVHQADRSRMTWKLVSHMIFFSPSEMCVTSSMLGYSLFLGSNTVMMSLDMSEIFQMTKVFRI